MYFIVVNVNCQEKRLRLLALTYLQTTVLSQKLIIPRIWTSSPQRHPISFQQYRRRNAHHHRDQSQECIPPSEAEIAISSLVSMEQTRDVSQTLTASARLVATQRKADSERTLLPLPHWKHTWGMYPLCTLLCIGFHVARRHRK